MAISLALKTAFPCPNRAERRIVAIGLTAPNSRLTRSFDTQKEAIAAGRDIAKNQQAELRIQGSDAKFREAWSYGNDPYPPKG